MTIKATVTAAVLAVLVAAAVPAAAEDAHVIEQASTGKLGREVAFLVCFNPEQVDVAVKALFRHESAAVPFAEFVLQEEDRGALNLNTLPSMPAVGNFSIWLLMETADGGSTATTCSVVYYSGSPLREIAREPLTVRKFVKR